MLPLPNSAPDSLTPSHWRVPLPELVEVATTALDDVVAVDLVLEGATLDVVGLETIEVVAGTLEGLLLDVMGLETAEVVAGELEALMLDDLLDVTGLETGTLDAMLDATGVEEELPDATIPPAVDMEMLDVVGLDAAELLSATEVDRIGLDVALDTDTELLGTTGVDRAGLDTITLEEIVAEWPFAEEL
jgi:hypothetical protein